MLNYLPFNSINHDRVGKAEDWAWYFATFIGNGVFPKPETGLQVVASNGMTVLAKAGYAFINGYAFRNPEDFSITLDTADGSLPRIDRVIVRWDITQRMIYIAVLKGTPSANPVARSLTRTSEIYDLCVADVLVGRGVTSITQANITDQRYNSSLCGIVHGVVDQIDATTLTAQFNDFFRQYEQQIISQYNNYLADINTDRQGATSALNEFTTWLAGYKTDTEDDIAAWLDTLHDLLDEETATHLQQEIETNAADIAQLQRDVQEIASITTVAWLGAAYCGGTYLVS